jgi:Ran GTPase-activating protein (RanGAP) involved in mRNA processing and transport
MPLLAITRKLDAAAIAKRLMRAKEDKTSSLAFFQIEFDDQVTTATIALFRHASRQALRWNELNLFGCMGQVETVLQVCTALDLFAQITIKGMTRDERIGQQAALSLGMAMKFNTLLHTLHLGHIALSREQSAALSAGLRTITDEGQFKQLSMSRITFAEDAIAELASGLQNNSSIQTLAVTSCNLTDAQIAQLVQGMVNHSSLKVLRLFGNQGHTQALMALVKLLSSTKLESLDFHHQSWQQGGLQSQIKILAAGLKGNQHIKRLNLSSNILVDEDLSSLSKILWTCPRLEELDLDLNNITNRGLETFASQNIPGSLKRLRLSGNHLTTEGAIHLLKILQVNLELGFVDCHRFWVRSEKRREIQHFMDLNRSGRILLRHSSTTPIALWPLVLAKANIVLRSNDERRADVLFQLLQGPALMERTDSRVAAKEEDKMHIEEAAGRKRAALD